MRRSFTITGVELSTTPRLEEALTHSSYGTGKDNRHLAFLGDVVLALAVSLHIIKNYPHLSIGRMTQMRASVINAHFLSETARSWHAQKLLKLGKGERQSGGEEKESILAEMAEAVIGAFYLDNGYESAVQFVENYIIPDTFNIEYWNAKGKLQEISLRNEGELPVYITTSESDIHNKIQFKSYVKINGIISGNGEGKNKKEAEESAAQCALAKLRKGSE
jgi:ribonuclease-3